MKFFLRKMEEMMFEMRSNAISVPVIKIWGDGV